MIRGCVPSDRAQRIFNHAQYIASRSEHLWTNALGLRGTGSEFDVGLAAVVPFQRVPSDSAADEINLGTTFGVDSMGCEECASITSPAAFFVDLLETLSDIPAESKSQNVDEKRSLLEVLFMRRADLGDLELSCANTKIVVPYIDLVNEVLESVVWNLASGNVEVVVRPFDASEEDTSEDCLMQPQNTNFTAMSFSLSSIPCTCTTRLKLLSIFQSPPTITKTEDLTDSVQEALRFSRAAELLNLQHEDFVALTGQGFYSYELVNRSTENGMTEDEYSDSIGLKQPRSRYWGFNTDEEMAPENEPDQDLTNIKNELPPRSGLSLEDLLLILRTQWLNEQLVVVIPSTPDGEDLEATELLAFMRLQE
ncbi:hypothetical protein BDV19DRAFT_389939 [Aspergillus venezuelensis]